MLKWFDWLIASAGVTLLAWLTVRELGNTKYSHNKSSASEYNSPPSDLHKSESPSLPAGTERWHPEESNHRGYERKYWGRSIYLNAAIAVGAFGSAIFSWQAAYQAHRQADSAEKNLPRAWVYVEFPRLLIVKAFSPPNQRQGLRNFSVSVPFYVHNYGQLPATIITMNASLFVPNIPAFPSYPIFDNTGSPIASVSQSMATRLMNFDGATISSGESFGPALQNPDLATEFVFLNQPDMYWHVEGLRKWILILVKYRDPLGDDRETSYLGELSGTTARPIFDKRYAYQK